MRSYVITISNNDLSVKTAERCVASGKKFDEEIEHFWAFTPADDPVRVADRLSVSTTGFREKYSKFDRCLAAFLSHHALWRKCVKLNEQIHIFEHDAILVDRLPSENTTYNGCMSLGAPSYGKFNKPPMFGVNKLTSKPYFPGAHAYRLRPDRAKQLVDRAKIDACPTDVFLDVRRFPWLEEYYPWPVEARDDFTTIQNELGCRVKHRYGPGYQIV